MCSFWHSLNVDFIAIFLITEKKQNKTVKLLTEKQLLKNIRNIIDV